MPNPQKKSPSTTQEKPMKWKHRNPTEKITQQPRTPLQCTQTIPRKKKTPFIYQTTQNKVGRQYVANRSKDFAALTLSWTVAADSFILSKHIWKNPSPIREKSQQFPRETLTNPNTTTKRLQTLFSRCGGCVSATGETTAFSFSWTSSWTGLGRYLVPTFPTLNDTPISFS